MSESKTQRNARILRLRAWRWPNNRYPHPPFSWIAKQIAIDFPDDPAITRQTCWSIYRREVQRLEDA